MKLELQINPKAIKDNSINSEHSGVMITPPIDEDFWFYKVPVSDKQAVVGFPKFGVIGIGFQHELDWNRNLPSTAPSETIYEHIEPNKDDDSIPRDRCIEAIRMIQDAVLNIRN